MYEGYIYCITNDINNKIYIGQTTQDVSRRFSGHIYRAKNNSNQYIHNAMRTHGIDSFHEKTIEKICCKTQEELNGRLDKLEQYYILVYNSLNPNGYNNTIGGRKYDGFNEKNRMIYQFSLNGKLINTYKSLKDATDLTGFGKTGISKCCLGKTHSSHGYIWKYYDVDIQTNFYSNNFTNDKNDVCLCGDHVVKKVKQYDTDGNLIRIYNSAIDAENESSSYFKRQGIQSCCSGNSRIYKNYFWRYVGDDLSKFDTSLKRKKESTKTQKRHKNKLSNNLKIHKKRVNMRAIGICKYDKSLNFIEYYENVYSIPNLTEYQIINILKCCQGKQIFANNYIWRFEYDDVCKYKTGKDTWHDIAMLDEDNNVIKVFKNAKLAADYVKGDRSCIIECCGGKTNRKTHKHFYWKYYDEIKGA